jgi:hypothetical protein
MVDTEIWELWTPRMREVYMIALACSPQGFTSGPLHIILDDPNWQRHHVEYALEQFRSGAWPDEHELVRGKPDYDSKMGVVCCEALLELSDDQRREILGWTAENGYETEEEEQARAAMLAEPCLFPRTKDDKGGGHSTYLSYKGMPIWATRAECLMRLGRPYIPLSETEMDLAECVPLHRCAP